ncbi:MAG: hypothetical protein ACI8Q1_002370 [Parvicella sp.]|jgi:hypothetical protein
MKKYILTTALISVAMLSWSQEEIEVPSNIGIKDDTSKIKIGNITIIFNEDGADDFEDFDSEEFGEDEDDENSVGFVGQINFGMNGWLTADNQTTFASEYQTMSLDLAKSRSFGFDFMFQGADLFNKRLFISPGFGVNWNGYKFEENITVSTGGDTTIFATDTVRIFDKYKLRATYVQVPLMLGVRLGDLSNKPFIIEGGVIGGFNIGSLVKQKYVADGTAFKDKISDDFNINPFKLEVVARLSIGELGLYGKYAVTTMFEAGKTQAVQPFSIGLTLGSI